MGTKTQRKLEAQDFWGKHGLNVSLDCFKVNLLFSIVDASSIENTDLSAWHDRSKTPHLRRQRNGSSQLITEMRYLRQSDPNLGNEKLYCKLRIWCAEEALLCLKPRTIARLIADTPDWIRCTPQPVKRLRKTKNFKRRLRKEKGTHFIQTRLNSKFSRPTVPNFALAQRSWSCYCSN